MIFIFSITSKGQFKNFVGLDDFSLEIHNTDYVVLANMCFLFLFDIVWFILTGYVDL